PTFLLLAGLSLGLGWGASDWPRNPAARRAELARGLQLVVLGYALRLYMWMLDAGGALHLDAWTAALPLGAGLYALSRALGEWAQVRPARRLAGFGLAGFAFGLAFVSILIPDRLWRVTRVDILQAIGASLVLLALLRPAVVRRPALAVMAALVVAT